MRKVVVQNNASNSNEKKSRSMMPSFLKPNKRRLSTHHLGGRGKERVIDPSHEKYDPESKLGNEQVISAFRSDSDDIDPFENDLRPRNSLFGARKSDMSIGGDNNNNYNINNFLICIFCFIISS